MHGRIIVARFVGLLVALTAAVVVAQTPSTGTDRIGTNEIGTNETETNEIERIETDRDSYTPATTTAGKGLSILESAYTFSDNRVGFETHSLPELVNRYGLTDWLELRLGGNYEVGGASTSFSGGVPSLDEPGGKGLEQGSQVIYGFKAAVTDQNHWLPESAVIVEAGTPTSGKDVATQFMTTYVFGWMLPHDWKLDVGMRYGYDSTMGDHFNIWSPSTVLKIPVFERWTVHAEYFGIFSEGLARDSTQHYFSPGIHYLVNQDLEVGIRVGWGLNTQSANFFSNVGLGWRF